MSTIFLDTVIGWFLVILSIFLIVTHEYIKLVMDEVIEHPRRFFIFAIFIMILGLLMVTGHNVWLMSWIIIITLFSWLVLISGVIQLVFPDITKKMGKSYFNTPIRIQITGVVLLIIGGGLLFHVYYPHF